MLDKGVASFIKHNSIRQRLGAGRKFSVETSWLAVKVYQEYERVASGVESASKFVTKISEAIDRYVNQAIYEALLQAGMNLGAQWSKTSKLDSTTKGVFRTLCQDVAMASNSEVVVMGTRTALASVFDLNNVAWASNDMKNEMYTTGKFGFFEGIMLVELKQGFKPNDTSKYLIDNDVLFIMPVGLEPMIKLVYEGDTQMFNVTDPSENMDFTLSQEVQTKIGIAVVTNRKFGMWKIVP